MKKVYIAVISKIIGLERLTFSEVINDFIDTLDPNIVPLDSVLETGISVKPDDISNGIYIGGRYFCDDRAIATFNRWLLHLELSDYKWAPWMKDWTDGTLYLLYTN